MSAETVFLTGALTSLGLIVAIGPQNAFVLRQGIAGAFIAEIVVVSVLAEGVLIALGIAGFGALLSGSDSLRLGISVIGGGLLLFLGVTFLREALHRSALVAAGEARAKSRIQAILFTAGLSLLNPHAILDTVVVLGSLSTRYPEALRAMYGAGALAGAILWFVVLGFGARRAAPLLRRPGVWRALHLVFGVMMLVMGCALLHAGFRGVSA